MSLISWYGVTSQNIRDIIPYVILSIKQQNYMQSDLLNTWKWTSYRITHFADISAEISRSGSGLVDIYITILWCIVQIWLSHFLCIFHSLKFALQSRSGRSFMASSHLISASMPLYWPHRNHWWFSCWLLAILIHTLAEIRWWNI